MRLLVVLLAILLMGVAPPAWAEFSAPPEKACSYLNGTGIKTGSYKNLAGARGCVSRYFDLSDGLPANDIAYYVAGTPTAATKLKLVLNVHDRANETSARQSLVLYANKLVKESLQLDMLGDLQAAIMKGKPRSWKKGVARIGLIRDDWPSGKGYSLKLVID
ncbi:MAG: hypothetical protein KJ720_05870 [Proteobacteria bacterium]|nr:hypothetical protein [Pseudomonadota bacterium]MBU1451670.1 hypothetical protein [Pseudomonadota bacterium]MBU2469365.1 hypothetical protein [Pseudomonadota bacterium]MBU2518803.1 hypothetical protein [Pseudomonadota bacterium]